MSKISIGTAQFGMPYGVSNDGSVPSLSDIDKILNYAKENKIDTLDTAPAYGVSEENLGNFDLSSFKVVTKTRHFKNKTISAIDCAKLEKDFLFSLKNMKQEKVYGLLIHNAPDLMKSGSDLVFKVLLDLKENQKINKVGVSVYDEIQLRFALKNFDIDIVQLPLNILDQRFIHNGLIDYMQKKGIEIHIRSIFLQGLLLMNIEDRPKKFKEWNDLWILWDSWLKDNKISALQACLRFASELSQVKKIVVGVHNIGQLQEIILSTEGQIPEIPEEFLLMDENLFNPSKW